MRLCGFALFLALLALSVDETAAADETPALRAKIATLEAQLAALKGGGVSTLGEFVGKTQEDEKDASHAGCISKCLSDKPPAATTPAAPATPAAASSSSADKGGNEATCKGAAGGLLDCSPPAGGFDACQGCAKGAKSYADCKDEDMAQTGLFYAVSGGGKAQCRSFTGYQSKERFVTATNGWPGYTNAGDLGARSSRTSLCKR